MNLLARTWRSCSFVARVAAVSALCAVASTAQAQVTRGFIGAHEYALPDPAGMKPWNVFVEYSTLQKTKKVWDNNGDKASAGDTEVLVSLSKFVHFWEAFPGVGVAMELIVPKVGIRDKVAGTSTGGIADVIVGPAWWIKPAPNWTLGSDFFFIQVPIGDPDVGGGNRWNQVASVFWDGQFDKINWTGNLGVTRFGEGANGLKEKPKVYLNNRLGFRASQLIEPYIGIDYERQAAGAGNGTPDPTRSSHALTGSLGLMFYALDKGHIAVHYNKGLKGENREVENSLNLRFAYVF